MSASEFGTNDPHTCWIVASDRPMALVMYLAYVMADDDEALQMIRDGIVQDEEGAREKLKRLGMERFHMFEIRMEEKH